MAKLPLTYAADYMFRSELRGRLPVSALSYSKLYIGRLERALESRLMTNETKRSSRNCYQKAC
jgi:hypothetical protein